MSLDHPAFTEKRVSQWEELMRKFSEAHKEECKSVSLEIPRVARSIKQFPTGSQYEGTWSVLGMSGFGIYTFPNGVIYKGEFQDGMFQGEGELQYPCGAILKGKWHHGKILERTLIFADGLEYSEDDWKYCRMPDRRFTIEYEEGLQPGGASFLTAEQPTRDIPPGYYDTGDGFYDSNTKVVYKAQDLTAIIRSPSVREQKWIIENCRTYPEKSLGPRPDLYEQWLEPEPYPEPVPQPPVNSRAAAPTNSICSLDPFADIHNSKNTGFQRGASSTTSFSRPFVSFQSSKSVIRAISRISVCVPPKIHQLRRQQHKP